MAVNLRLDDAHMDMLRKQAALERRSMNAIMLRALEDYCSRNAREAIVRKTAQEQAAKWHELLERLK